MASGFRSPTSFSRLHRYLSLVAFPHTVFALPFALMAYLAATGGRVRPWNLAFVVLAMVAARTAAMTFNRIADRRLDAANPRTVGRELVRGAVTVREAWGILIVSSVLFVTAAWLLNPLAFALSPVALAVLLGYSYTKRLTALSHFVLGIALGMAPPGAWIAATGGLDWPPVILGAGVVLWVAGFDIIYACQDAAHDKLLGLRSAAVSLGVRRALILSAVLHALCLPLFWAFGHTINLGIAYLTGLAIVAVSFVYQHSIVSDDNLSRVNAAFFTTNGFVSLCVLLFFVLDIYW